MSYTTNYGIRYQIVATGVPQQTEVAVMTAAQDIQNEDPSAPDHANRITWANWANKNSKEATVPFLWPIAMNPAIVASIEADPSGAGVKDTDVQFVVNSVLPQVIADFIAHPPA